MKITLHRALAELKLIDSKIQKKTNTVELLGANQKGKLVNNLITEDDFVIKAKADYQSINDLINRKLTIKKLITEANNNTEITINGDKMTIADAINKKNDLILKKGLLNKMNLSLTSVIGEVNRANEQVNQNALRIAESALQKDNVKISDSDAISITEPYIEKNKFNLIDPLDIKKEIEKLDEEIDNFDSEVDATLSEINAITTIEL